MIRGAVFDIDGTLLDSMPIWREVGNRYLKQNGIPEQEGLSDILFPMSLEEGAEYLRFHFIPEKNAEEIKNDVLRIVESFYREEVPLKKGVKEFLHKLREHGVRMILATTGDENLAMAALQRLEVSGYFENILTCTGLHTTKRESLIYEKAMEMLQCTPSETCVFEDVLHAIISAKNSGAKVAAVADAESQNDWDKICRMSDYAMEDFSDFDRFWNNIILKEDKTPHLYRW